MCRSDEKYDDGFWMQVKKYEQKLYDLDRDLHQALERDS
jgi:hypothetical protein